MGTRGPAKRPAKEHKKRGTYRPDRHAEPEGVKVGEPFMPRGMPKLAQAAWKRIVPELVAAGLVARIDQEALRQLCEAIADYERAEDAISKVGLLVPHTTTQGDLILKLNPAWTTKHNSRTAIIALCQRFGMTPSGRTGLGTKKDEGMPAELAAILGVKTN